MVWHIYADISTELILAYSEQNDKDMLIPHLSIKMSKSIRKLEAVRFFENFIRQNVINVHNKGC